MLEIQKFSTALSEDDHKKLKIFIQNIKAHKKRESLMQGLSDEHEIEIKEKTKRFVNLKIHDLH